MAYTTINKSTDYFNTITYTGDAQPNTNRSAGFEPGWIWIKQRNGTGNHRLLDSVRGANKLLYSTGTNAEDTSSMISAITSTGYTTSNTDSGNVNGNGESYVNWFWKANGAASSNTDGTITSSVSANTTSGFSIATYTGNGTGSATVGHGLGVAPAFVIIKCLSVDAWQVFPTGATRLVLNSSATDYANYPITKGATTITLPSTVDNAWNANSVNYVMYTFADVKGFSKFGSYTGNGSTDGTFVYTGFKPAWVMYKASSISGQSWLIHDNKRGNQGANANPQDLRLLANATNTEDDVDIDFLSNGFKPRAGDAHINSSGTTYIYMAFAEQPLVGDNPATAR